MIAVLKYGMAKLWWNLLYSVTILNELCAEYRSRAQKSTSAAGTYFDGALLGPGALEPGTNSFIAVRHTI